MAGGPWGHSLAEPVGSFPAHPPWTKERQDPSAEMPARGFRAKTLPQAGLVLVAVAAFSLGPDFGTTQLLSSGRRETSEPTLPHPREDSGWWPAVPQKPWSGLYSVTARRFCNCDLKSALLREVFRGKVV